MWSATLEPSTAIKKKCPSLSMKGAIMLYYSAHVQDMLHSTCWTVVAHPRCSPDLSLHDLYVLSPPNKMLKDHTFGSDKDMKATLVQ